MITIVDYGMGNLGSVLNMFKKVGAVARISSDLNEISKAEKILLPGVGAFDAAMQRITDAGMKDILTNKAMVEQIPVLGICLGMQLLTQGSEEGVLDGLGWIKGKAYHFHNRIDESLRVPHMGWNTATIQNESQLTKNFEGELRFYFVHSYFVRAENPDHSMMKTNYGTSFDSALCQDNIFGSQFHPEKSHKFGMNLFRNFASL